MTAPLSSPSTASTATTALNDTTDERTLVRAVLALGVGGFSIGTGEFVIMGLLPEVARDIGVSIPEAGHVISAYALGVVVGAPVLAVLAANWGRRALLMALMAVYALGNFASALAPGYGSLAAMRLLTGLPHGTYFGVAALVAAALAPPGRRARRGLGDAGVDHSHAGGSAYCCRFGRAFWLAVCICICGRDRHGSGGHGALVGA